MNLTNNKFFECGGRVILIETSNEILYIDVFEDLTKLPADLSGADVRFHLMEFATRSHIWSKECVPMRDPNAGFPGITYPFTVPVHLTSSDTLDLEGHYKGQLELKDHSGSIKIPFEIEIIIRTKASL
jgi:hypothetical protein